MFQANEPDEGGLIGVYMHLLFDTSIHTGIFWHYNAYSFEQNDIIIYGFDTSILKTFPFKICPKMYYGKKCKDVLLEGDGHLTKKPSLLKVKNHINKNTPKHYSSYISSHEIIIRKDIPLSLCKFIIIHKDVMNNKYKKDIETLLEKYPHIQVIFNDTTAKSYKELLNGN
jgi:hypothetical protein